MLNVMRWAARRRPARRVLSHLQRHARVPRSRGAGGRTTSSSARRGFTAAHLRGGRLPRLAHDGDARRALPTARSPAATPFVYAYYPGVDAVAHEYGLHRGAAYSGSCARRLIGSSPLARRVARRHRAAGHGRPRAGPSRTFVDWIDIDDLSRSRRGDGRRWSLPHAVRAARRRSRPRARPPATSWATRRGCSPAANCSTTVGWAAARPARSPVVSGTSPLAARTPVAFVDPGLPHERKLRSGHGSVTADEMFVPLVAGWGRHG